MQFEIDREFVRNGIWGLMNDEDKPAFLKKESAEI